VVVKHAVSLWEGHEDPSEMLKKVSSKAAGEIATGGVHYTRPPQARQGALPPKGYV